MKHILPSVSQSFSAPESLSTTSTSQTVKSEEYLDSSLLDDVPKHLMTGVLQPEPCHIQAVSITLKHILYLIVIVLLKSKTDDLKTVIDMLVLSKCILEAAEAEVKLHHAGKKLAMFHAKEYYVRCHIFQFEMSIAERKECEVEIGVEHA